MENEKKKNNVSVSATNQTLARCGTPLQLIKLYFQTNPERIRISGKTYSFQLQIKLKMKNDASHDDLELLWNNVANVASRLSADKSQTGRFRAGLPLVNFLTAFSVYGTVFLKQKTDKTFKKEIEKLRKKLSVSLSSRTRHTR